MILKIRKLTKTLLYSLFCLLSLSAYAANANQDSKTIYANPNFQKDYYLLAGETYAKGYPDLTYKMMDVTGQKGMFDSYEHSILYVNITNTQGLPTGLNMEQNLDRSHPANNTLYFSGTLPLTLPEGIYTVSLTGIDGAKPTNSAVQTINLHITSNTPQPKQSQLQVTGEVGQAPNTQNMRTYFRANQIDQFQVVNNNTLPPGIGFTSNGDFTGHYSQAGVYDKVEVQAKNTITNVWSTPILVVFYIAQGDTPPVPASTPLLINANKGDAVSTPTLSTYFTLNSHASPIQSYRIVDAAKLPPGVTFTSDGHFHGHYTQEGFYSDVQVQAKNAAPQWSAPLSVHFSIAIPDSAPVPLSTPLNVNVTQGDTINLPNMQNAFQLNPGASNITQYRVADINKLPPGITFTADGIFHGQYNQSGSYPDVHVEAQNNTHTWSAPYIINFAVSVPDSPPTPRIPATLDVNSHVGDTVNLTNMSAHFDLSPGASAIIDYRIVDATSLPPGVAFAPDGNFSGTYTQAGTFPVQVQAENNTHIWSSPYTMNFIVTPNTPLPPVTLTCPALNQVIGCAANATVLDSSGAPHVFVNKGCQSFIIGFSLAQLRSNPSYADGIACIYSDYIAGPAAIYVLDPAPANTYYSNDTTKTVANCSVSVAGCQFNIPQ